ncbi:hypothetical protein OSTOST_24431, partial [Ostertagia ostertagi]
TFFFVALFFLPETPKFLLISRSDRPAAERSVRFYHGSDCDVDTVIKDIILNFRTQWHFGSMLLSSTYFLEEIGLDQAVASWSSTAMTLGYVLGVIAGSKWDIERLGRRTILLSFTTVDNLLLPWLDAICAELSPIVEPLKYSCLVLLIAYAFIYGSGVGPISWFISSELVPQKYRSLAQSTCYSLNTIIVVILTFSILPLYGVVGSYAFLILYTVPSLISIVILYCYLPETKGREIHEIVAELRGKTKSS